ncbi:MAG: hypothetical protein MUF34_25035 [Polyangiaceae bacterium]|jgi:hypothetical protein|nr:hypothetical protein [Polyangiaceae bacterium]
MRTVFFRPIASLSRAFDWLVLGEHPWAMHLHSVLWYGLLVAVAAALYRRLLGSTWAAGLAALLYAVDDAHGVPVGWLANRNGLCAAVFGLLAVGAYAHGRERGSRPAAWLAHAALAASLLSAEAGLAAFLYMGAYIHPARPTPCRARQGPWRLEPRCGLAVFFHEAGRLNHHGLYRYVFTMPPARPSKRQRVLAAPIVVVTAFVGSACRQMTYTNPGPPEGGSPPEPTAPLEPTSAISASAPVEPAPSAEVAPPTAPITKLEELPDAPRDQEGRVVTNPDGSCAYHYPPPSMKCPPQAHCNPGPPRAPLKVKCPDGAGR